MPLAHSLQSVRGRVEPDVCANTAEPDRLRPPAGHRHGDVPQPEHGMQPPGDGTDAWASTPRPICCRCCGRGPGFASVSGDQPRQALGLQPGGRDVGGVELVDVELSVQLGELGGAERSADRFDERGEVVAVGLDDLVGRDRHDVVGVDQALVVLEHDPILFGDDAIGREQDGDVDLASVERGDSQRTATVQRHEVHTEVDAVDVDEPGDTSTHCRDSREARPDAGPR